MKLLIFVCLFSMAVCVLATEERRKVVCPRGYTLYEHSCYKVFGFQWSKKSVPRVCPKDDNLADIDCGKTLAFVQSYVKDEKTKKSLFKEMRTKYYSGGIRLGKVVGTLLTTGMIADPVHSGLCYGIVSSGEIRIYRCSAMLALLCVKKNLCPDGYVYFEKSCFRVVTFPWYKKLTQCPEIEKDEFAVLDTKDKMLSARHYIMNQMENGTFGKEQFGSDYHGAIRIEKPCCRGKPHVSHCWAINQKLHVEQIKCSQLFAFLCQKKYLCPEGYELHNNLCFTLIAFPWQKRLKSCPEKNRFATIDSNETIRFIKDYVGEKVTSGFLAEHVGSGYVGGIRLGANNLKSLLPDGRCWGITQEGEITSFACRRLMAYLCQQVPYTPHGGLISFDLERNR